MCVTICGRFRPDEGAVAGYGNRIRVKYTAKWGVQIAGMIFQTRSRAGYSCEGREWKQFHLLLKLTKEFKKILSVFNIRKVE